MSTVRLSRTAIARGLASGPGRRKEPSGIPPDVAETMRELTRREAVLLVGGAAAALAAGRVGASRLAWDPQAGVTSGVAWLRAGSSLAALNARLFGGAPRLALQTDPWRAVLTSATYPGTGLPADIELETFGSGFTTMVGIRMALGGFDAVVPLAKWLAGEKAAASDVRLERRTIELGSGSALTLGGTAVATLIAKDWALHLAGDGIARLHEGSREVIADEITISLAPAETPSLFSRGIARRSVITLERGDRTWNLDAPASSNGSLAFGTDAFDRLAIECAETGAGAVHRAFMASGGSASASYRAGTAAVPLTDVRYARLLDDGSYHVAAQYADHLAHTGGSGALLVGAAEWAPPFEAAGNGSGVAKVTCVPAVYGVSAPLGDVIASPLVFPEDAKRVANFGTTRPKALRGLTVATAKPAAQQPGQTQLPDLTNIRVIRPDDLLTLTFHFFNFKYVAGSPAKLVRNDLQLPARVSVTFPPQHFFEQAFVESALTVSVPPIQTYIADPSRLAFDVSDARADTGITFTLEGLLDWSGFTHSVVPAAQDSATSPTMRVPRDGTEAIVGAVVVPETSIEVPWGLYMSPSTSEYWTHSTTPRTFDSKTDLWLTRLHRRLILTGASTALLPIDVMPARVEPAPRLRAVWARWYDLHLAGTATGPLGDGVPTTTLKRNDFTRAASSTAISGIANRWAITDLTARYHNDPIVMRNMMLSSLGAWFDGRGEWNTDALLLQHPAPFGIAASLLEWDHKATMGRDHYVKLVFSGRLFPFGHSAAFIIITERKFRIVGGRKYAYLLQRYYVKVREPVVTYHSSTSTSQRDRLFPFKQVEIKTLMTPPLLPAEQGAIGGLSADKLFWPKTASTGSKTMFQIEGTDWDGKVIKFSAPLIFMDVTMAVGGATSDESGAETAASAANTAYKLVSVDMKGATIAFAEPFDDTGKGDERNLPTANMYFSAELRTPPSFGEIRFYPQMLKATVSLDTVQKLTGSTAGTTIQISDEYRDFGFAGNNAEGMVFAKLPSPSSPDFPGALAGGLATPLPKFSGIGAQLGAIGGTLSQVGTGTFDPGDYFKSVLDAQLLGGITLKDLLDTGLALANMPTFQQIPMPEIPDKVSVQFKWETPISNKVLIFVPGETCTLSLNAVVTQSIKPEPDPPTFEVTAELTDFTLELVRDVFPAVNLKFKKLKFVSLNGGSPDVSPVIDDVEFVGSLAFLSELTKYMGSLGSGSGSGESAALARTSSATTAVTVVDAGPLKIDVDASGIRASLNIALPNIAVGAFSMSNMSIGALLTIPFTGAPVTLQFNFCSRQSPFSLTVMIYGGGGYVLMVFDAHGIVTVEISLEFGLGCAFGIGGIASGMVEVKGGVIIRWERLDAGDKLSFTMFIRIAGSLDILGIISVSLTFYLELKYETIPKGLPGTSDDGDKLTGTATLTIEIKILFFSFPVNLTVTKELAGKDPRFDQMMTQSEWDLYCGAFADASLGA